MMVLGSSGTAAYLDVLLVELGVVLQKVLWLHPSALIGLQVVIVVMSSFHPVFHPVTSIITWTDSVFYFSSGVQESKISTG